MSVPYEPLLPFISEAQEAFSRRERGCGNRIVFEASNLQCASLASKLAMQAMVDRGAMTPNEWRAVMNMAPVEGGEQPIRRLDTQVVDLAGRLLDMAGDIGTEKFTAMSEVVARLAESVVRRQDMLLQAHGEGERDEAQDQYQGRDGPQ